MLMMHKTNSTPNQKEFKMSVVCQNVGKGSGLSLYGTVSVLGFPNTMAQTVWFKQQEFVFSQFWRLEL